MASRNSREFAGGANEGKVFELSPGCVMRWKVEGSFGVAEKKPLRGGSAFEAAGVGVWRVCSREVAFWRGEGWRGFVLDSGVAVAGLGRWEVIVRHTNQLTFSVKKGTGDGHSLR